MSKNSGIIFNIKHFAIHDGPGIRLTIFLKGCPLKCKWCHNPESYKKEPQLLKYDSKEEIIGKEITLSEIIKEIEKDRIFFDESDGGVTLSGGEPLFQPNFIENILKYCNENDIHTTLDTSGYAPLENLKKIAEKVDLFLFDLKLFDSDKHKYFTGVDNKIIFENLHFLIENGYKTIIRLPLIPTINDDDKNISQIADFIINLEKIDLHNALLKVDLLPYHNFGIEKFKKLGIIENYDFCKKINRFSDPEIQRIKKIFIDKFKSEKINISVTIGGKDEWKNYKITRKKFKRNSYT